jgi:hypothetical protein
VKVITTDLQKPLRKNVKRTPCRVSVLILVEGTWAHRINKMTWTAKIMLVYVRTNLIVFALHG